MLPYWLSAIGICFIFKYGSILESFRRLTIELLPTLDKFYKCCLCMGFWSGLFFSIYSGLTNKLLFAFQSSAICWTADLLITLIINVNYFIEKLDSSDDSNPNK
jgi:hypothetical protein